MPNDQEKNRQEALIRQLSLQRTPDILDTFANLSNDEVTTSPEMATRMLDAIPADFWKDPGMKVLDPCCKTGIFLRECAKRFLTGLANVIPDPEERRAHVFGNMLFGIAITRLTHLVSCRTLYATKDASSDLAARLTTRMPRPEGNIIFPETKHEFDAKGRCIHCMIPEGELKAGGEQHAYPFLHKTYVPEFGDMKFDLIIGNPPYQMRDGGHGASSKPLYHLFVQESKRLDPRYLSMIIPARWYAGGKGLDDFREEMLNDAAIRDLVDIPNAGEVFPGVEIKGGVCYFLRDARKKTPEVGVRQMRRGEFGERVERRLDTHDVFIRNNESIGILDKVMTAWTGPWLSDKVSSRKPFGFPTNFTNFTATEEEDTRKIYANGRQGWVKRALIRDDNDWLDKWKVLSSRAYGAGETIPHQITGKPIVADPGSCCTETYLVVSTHDDEVSARNMATYMRSRFFRYLVSLKKNTQDINKTKFSLIPDLPMDRVWTDETLFARFGLTEDEIAHIHAMIRPM